MSVKENDSTINKTESDLEFGHKERQLKQTTFLKNLFLYKRLLYFAILVILLIVLVITRLTLNSNTIHSDIGRNSTNLTAN